MEGAAALPYQERHLDLAEDVCFTRAVRVSQSKARVTLPCGFGVPLDGDHRMNYLLPIPGDRSRRPVLITAAIPTGGERFHRPRRTGDPSHHVHPASKAAATSASAFDSFTQCPARDSLDCLITVGRCDLERDESSHSQT